ncbi:hypothetical protein [Arundinibacter roseus]|uniref:Uncharacterized protein n=1 Tax=Arundinibacter roseus TaxID=2070510 RepID=A0A4R4KC79_9BACT|nr:hypothetical protein [Arundinibacter roseus]TDB65273.1 hypothetical protein EZE20_11250 [Arundinibacter roseus]
MKKSRKELRKVHNSEHDKLCRNTLQVIADWERDMEASERISKEYTTEPTEFPPFDEEPFPPFTTE